MSQITDSGEAAAYLGTVGGNSRPIADTPVEGLSYEASSAAHIELDGCGCLTSEEHLSRCVLWVRPGVVRARPTSERTRASNRERVARWKAANPQRWREIQRASYERRKTRAA